MADFCGIPVIVDETLPPDRILVANLRPPVLVTKPGVGVWTFWAIKPPVLVFLDKMKGG